MTRSDLVRRISKETGLPMVIIRAALDGFCNVVVEVLEAEDCVKIPDFGKFAVHTAPARSYKTPVLEEYVKCPEKKRVRFYPGKRFKQILDGTAEEQTEVGYGGSYECDYEFECDI